MKNSKEIIYGMNPVLEAIKNGERVFHKILVARGRKKDGALSTVEDYCKRNKILFQRVEESEIFSLTGTGRHQGIAGLVSSVQTYALEDLIQIVFKKSKAPLVVIADGVEDPGNLGSIIRSGEVLGVDALIIPKDRASKITSTVAKRSAGATEYIPIAIVTNIIQTLTELKKDGFWIAGLEKGAEKKISDYDYKGPTAIVIGGESKGLRRLVKENCDFVVSIPMYGKVTSLNAASAAAILFYEISKQRWR